MNSMEISIGLLSISVYLKFKSVIVEGKSNDICVLEFVVKSDLVVLSSSFVLPLSELPVNPNLFVGYKHIDMEISVNAKLSLHPHPHIAIASLVNDIVEMHCFHEALHLLYKILLSSAKQMSRFGVLFQLQHSPFTNWANILLDYATKVVRD